MLNYLFSILDLPQRFLGKQSGLRGSSPSGGDESCVVIRMSGDLFYILDVTECFVGINNENSTAFETQFLDEGTVGQAKRSFSMIRQCLDLINSSGSAPAFLSKRQIHADGENRDIFP